MVVLRETSWNQVIRICPLGTVDIGTKQIHQKQTMSSHTPWLSFKLAVEVNVKQRETDPKEEEGVESICHMQLSGRLTSNNVWCNSSWAERVCKCVCLFLCLCASLMDLHMWKAACWEQQQLCSVWSMTLNHFSSLLSPPKSLFSYSSFTSPLSPPFFPHILLSTTDGFISMPRWESFLFLTASHSWLSFSLTLYASRTSQPFLSPISHHLSLSLFHLLLSPAFPTPVSIFHSSLLPSLLHHFLSHFLASVCHSPEAALRRQFSRW